MANANASNKGGIKMNSFRSSVEAETKKELKVLFACLSDSTLDLIYQDLLLWKGPVPNLAIAAIEAWNVDNGVPSYRRQVSGR